MSLTPSDLVAGFDPSLPTITDPGGIEALGGELAGAPRVVTIVGSSVAGLTLAARLGAAPDLRVVLVTGGPPLARRLVNGCSLRRATLAILGRSFGCGPERLVERLGGPGSTFSELRVVRIDGEAVAETRLHWGARELIGLSTRHGAILAALRAELRGAVTVVAGEVARGAGLEEDALPLTTPGGPARLRLPPGRHVVLNATPFAELLRPGRGVPPPRRRVVAVQVPMRPSGTLRFPGDVAVAPVLERAGGPHLAFYTPFADGDTPGATWYGINTTIVEAAAPRDAAIADVQRALLSMGAALGLEPVDEARTLAGAAVPVVEEGAVATQERLADAAPIVDAGRAFSPGAPAINVDGMLAGARAAEALAQAFLARAGAPPAAAAASLAAVDAALRPIRRRNRATAWFFFAAPPALRRLTLAALPRRAARTFTEDFAALGA